MSLRRLISVCGCLAILLGALSFPAPSLAAATTNVVDGRAELDFAGTGPVIVSPRPQELVPQSGNVSVVVDYSSAEPGVYTVYAQCQFYVTGSRSYLTYNHTYDPAEGSSATQVIPVAFAGPTCTYTVHDPSGPRAAVEFHLMNDNGHNLVSSLQFWPERPSDYDRARSSVDIEKSGAYRMQVVHDGVVVHSEDLGHRDRGRIHWDWSGRAADGSVLPERYYDIELLGTNVDGVHVYERQRVKLVHEVAVVDYTDSDGDRGDGKSDLTRGVLRNGTPRSVSVDTRFARGALRYTDRLVVLVEGVTHIPTRFTLRPRGSKILLKSPVEGGCRATASRHQQWLQLKVSRECIADARSVRVRTVAHDRAGRTDLLPGDQRWSTSARYEPIPD